jgi:hypothetical protein
LPDKNSPRHESGVIPFAPKKKKEQSRRPGRPGGGNGVVLATSGSLALAPQVADAPPKQKPIAFPTPSRWFSEKNNRIGFRLWDIVYLFTLARQALEAEDAIEWGARYFSGALSEEHGRAVLGVLAPGQEDEAETGKLHLEIIDAFRRSICQGLGRLLGKPHLRIEQVSAEEAHQLQLAMEAMYQENGWLLPAVPFTLHRMLRKSDLDDY